MVELLVVVLLVLVPLRLLTLPYARRERRLEQAFDRARQRRIPGGRAAGFH